MAKKKTVFFIPIVSLCLLEFFCMVCMARELNGSFELYEAGKEKYYTGWDIPSPFIVPKGWHLHNPVFLKRPYFKLIQDAKQARSGTNCVSLGSAIYYYFGEVSEDEEITVTFWARADGNQSFSIWLYAYRLEKQGRPLPLEVNQEILPLTRADKEWKKYTVKARIKSPSGKLIQAVSIALSSKDTGGVFFDDVEITSNKKLAPEALKQKPGLSPEAKEAIVNLGQGFVEGLKEESLVSQQAVEFHPVDISAKANMGFRDEMFGDGTGGWTDEGNNDIRDFPVGNRSFLGVPFNIIDPVRNKGKSCIMLRGARSGQTFPAEVEVPVGRKAAALYFLHASAWTEPKKNAAVYILRYADGTSAELPILEGRDIFEWYVPMPLERCLVAWLGENPDAQDQVGIGLCTQVNPYPEKEISSLVLKSALNNTIPGIIGITLAEQVFKPVPEKLAFLPTARMDVRFKGELDWDEVSDVEASKTTSIPGNIIYDSGFNTSGNFTYAEWWIEGTRPSQEGIGVKGSRAVKESCRSDYFHLEPGRVYTLSAYIRADLPTEVKMMVLHARPKGGGTSRDDSGEKSYGFRKCVQVDKDWKRYHGSFIAQSSPDQPDLDSYFLMIKGEGAVFDNVQLEEGPLREYQPRPMEGYIFSAFNRDNGLFLYHPDSSIEVNCRLIANTALVEWVDLVVKDYYGREVMRQRKVLTLQPGQEQTWNEQITLHQPGVYRLELDAPGLVTSATHLPRMRSAGIAVVPPEWEGANQIMCMQYIVKGCIDPEEAIKAARMLGVHFFRFQVEWRRIEPEKGVFKFNNPIGGTKKSGYDDELVEPIKAGLVPWMGVDNIHLRSYCTTAPDWLLSTGVMDDPYAMPVSQEALERWRIYVRELVTHFKDRIRYFECMNEAGASPGYIEWLKVFYKTIKEVDPDLKVVAPAGSNLEKEIGGSWKPFNYGLLDNIDIFSFHNYAVPDADMPGFRSGLTAHERYAELRKFMSQFTDKYIPFWSNEYTIPGGEWSVPIDDRWPPIDFFRRRLIGNWEIDFNEAVNWAAKDVIAAYYNGVRLFSPHILLAGGYHDQMHISPTHGIGYGRVLKPYVIAFASSCYHLRDAEPANWFKVKEDGSVYIFKTKEGSLAVLFAKPGSGLEYTWPRAPKELVVENIFGADYPWVKQDKASLKMAVGAEPVFLILRGATPGELTEWLKSAVAREIPIRQNREFSGKFVPMTNRFPEWEISRKITNKYLPGEGD